MWPVLMRSSYPQERPFCGEAQAMPVPPPSGDGSLSFLAFRAQADGGPVVGDTMLYTPELRLDQHGFFLRKPLSFPFSATEIESG